MQNFVPNETIIYDDRKPQWMKKKNEIINLTEKPILQAINLSTKTLPYIDQFRAVHDQLGFPIEKSKNDYYSKLSQKLSG